MAAPRLFALPGAAQGGNAAHDAMGPFRWGGDHPFAEGRFPTEDGRARLVAVAQKPLPEEKRLSTRLDLLHLATRGFAADAPTLIFVGAAMTLAGRIRPETAADVRAKG